MRVLLDSRGGAARPRAPRPTDRADARRDAAGGRLRSPLGALRGSALAATAALAILLGAVPASGDPITFPECKRQPTEADIEGAKGAHKAATQFFERGDYDRAIQYWNDAYQFDCTKPALLLNIANAYEKKGDKAAAVTALETYLMRAPNAPDAKTIAEKLVNLKSSLRPATPAASATTTATTAPTSEPPPKTPKPATPSVLPWVVVGVGGAAAITGAILLPIGMSAVSSAEEACPSHDNCTSTTAVEDGNSGRTKEAIGAVALAAGGGLIAGGLVWEFLFNKPQAATPGGVQVAPVVGPGASGIRIQGSF